MHHSNDNEEAEQCTNIHACSDTALIRTGDGNHYPNPNNYAIQHYCDDHLDLRFINHHDGFSGWLIDPMFSFWE